jgi:anti-sigma regulatory factor (Ser/Thr protein kinase)
MIVRKRFEASEGSVGAARRFVAAVVSDAPTEVQDSVSVMVSELSTNALLHASGGFEVAVDHSELTISVSVIDRGDGTPLLQSPKFSEPHGRGLRIVAALSDEWGVSATSDGKAVWFRVKLRDPAATATIGGVVCSTSTAPAAHRESTSAPSAAAPSRHRTSRTRSPGVGRLTVPGRSSRSPVPA